MVRSPQAGRGTHKQTTAAHRRMEQSVPARTRQWRRRTRNTHRPQRHARYLERIRIRRRRRMKSRFGTLKAVAEYLGKSERTVWRMAQDGRMPHPVPGFGFEWPEVHQAIDSWKQRHAAHAKRAEA